MNKILMLIIIFIIFFVFVLKLCQLYYKNKIDILTKDKKVINESASLMNSSVSYEMFKRISNEASVKNSPVRLDGDFLDFLECNLESNIQNLENKILKLDYEEKNG